MTKIEIPFNKWSEERLETGMKFATSRNKPYGKPGDTFSHDGFEYTLELIVKLPLWFIRDYLYDTEGCSSPKDFEDIWKWIHPRKGWVEKQEVFYHYFGLPTNKIPYKVITK